MTYDIFISYSSLDKDWANKLNAELIKRNLKTFLDITRLTAGDEWEDQLKEALNNSKHMVFLWSANARNSDWVNKEAGYFSVAVTGTDKKSIPLVLNDIPKAYSNIQAVNDIKEQDLYGQGANAVSQSLWDTITQKIYDSINLTDDRKPIRQLILTLSKPELQALNFDWIPPLGKSLNTLLPLAGYNSTTILDLYGNNKRDWKPFGGQSSITQILNDILTETNVKRELNYKWVPIDESRFWGDDAEEVESQINILKKELSVIILDPIALYDEDVRTRFDMILDCLGNKDLLVMSFSSFELSQGYSSWRELIKSTSRKFYSSYFKPPIPRNMMAQFTANPLDKKDARRFIQQIISDSNNAVNKSKSPYLAI